MHGFIRVAAVAPALRVAYVDFNVTTILNACATLNKSNCQIALFPELCITGYSCGDLFFQTELLKNAFNGLRTIQLESHNLNMGIIVGLPLMYNGRLYNCAVLVANGLIIGVVPKSFLPNRGEFYEERWFDSGIGISGELDGIPFGTDILFDVGLFKFGLEICEDLWAPIPPSTHLALAGAQVIFNPSASNALIAKTEYRRELIKQQSARTNSGYVYASAGPGESTTDIVYSGHLMICENGSILAESSKMTLENSTIITEIDTYKIDGERLRNSSFSKSRTDQSYRTICFTMEDKWRDWSTPLIRTYNKTPFVPSDDKERDNRCKEIIAIQSMGLAKRLSHIDTKTAVIGVSGGLDSTLALLVCVEAFKTLGLDMKGIKAVTMPGPGTSERTEKNAMDLSQALGVDLIRLPIHEAVATHLRDIGHSEQDNVYENAQARERTQILFDLANKYHGIVVGTGNMSEMALGWSTYSGDQMSSYGVNCGVPKTLVKYLVRWYAEQMTWNETLEPLRNVLVKTLDTPISPELMPLGEKGEIIQKTEDLVGPYELHDFFLFHMIRNGFSPDKIRFICIKTFPEYSPEVITKWLKVFVTRFFQNQFKRSCTPDGPKVGTVALSPRGDWRMPSDAIPFDIC